MSARVIALPAVARPVRCRSCGVVAVARISGGTTRLPPAWEVFIGAGTLELACAHCAPGVGAVLTSGARS